MKRLIVILMASVACMVVTTVAAADDVAEVKAAVQAHWAAINAGDMAAVAEHHMPDFSGFLSGGGLLMSFASHEEQKTAFRASSEAGYKANWQIRHLEVKIYGNTAVAAFYLDGSATWQGGTAHGPLRVTEVWVKQGGKWKEAHHHDSPLAPAPAK